MAQSGQARPQEPNSPPPFSAAPSASIRSPSAEPPNPSLWRRILGRAHHGAPGPRAASEADHEVEPEADPDFEPEADHEEPLNEKAEELDPDDPRLVPSRKISRQVVAGLPRAQTFRRQQSELRDNLMPAELSTDERRALSTDRRLFSPPLSASESHSDPRSSAPDVLLDAVTAAAASPTRKDTFASSASFHEPPNAPSPSLASGTMDDGVQNYGPPVSTETLEPWPAASHAGSRPGSRPELKPLDTVSMTTSQYDQLIHDDLERIWILNLSMHFRDKSKREKFFITYRQSEFRWRRVTISLDYRSAPENSLELDLEHTKFQREKNAKIYEAIRESLQDIQFYDTVTNLKLQTTDGRLHVHVVEDVNEIIQYPTLRMVNHLRCRRIREREIKFDSHMSGFVYKVSVHGHALIKKEIPGPDTVDEFLYEVNALTQLQGSRHVIELYGIIFDDKEEHVKGLLIRYAEQGALIDMIYDNDHSLPWPRREKWARQIVAGLSEIHEVGFVQGDFTLSNIVIDSDDNAKIIDINRRGCPVGWEPPEATPLIDNGQRISMYIGVKSDLFQLGMVLWALATQEDEPEVHSRPLRIGPNVDCPRWFHSVVDTCLSENPRSRMSAASLETMFPGHAGGGNGWSGLHQYDRRRHAPSASADSSLHAYGPPIVRTINSPPPDWTYKDFGHTYVEPPTGLSNDPYYFPVRGRSPPSPIASHRGGLGGGRGPYNGLPAWSAYSYDQSRSDRSVSDDHGLDAELPAADRSVTPRTTSESTPAPALAEKELALVGAPLGISADDLPDVHPDLDDVARDMTPQAEAEPVVDLQPSMVTEGLVRQSTWDGGAALQPECVPLPPSPLGEEEQKQEEEDIREEEHATSESGGASLGWNEAEDDDDHVARIWPPPRFATGITGPVAHTDGYPEACNVLTAPEPAPQPGEAGPETGDLMELATEPLQLDRIKTPSTGRWLAVGTASLHGDGASILEEPTTTAATVVGTPLTPRPCGIATPTGALTADASPIRELPEELTGIGSAHDHTDDEAFRAQGAIFDHLGLLANDQPNHRQ